MTVLDIGCCGAYCGTCKALRDGACRGCKLGYENGGRDINRAKCRMKLCCFRDKGIDTCADCSALDHCEIIQPWFEKGYKYKVCKKYLDYIQKHGYMEFLEKADGWKDCYGELE